MTSNCRSLLNHKSRRFRSKQWEKNGYTRRKGVKSFGPVNNVLCHSPTGLYLGGILLTFDENINDTISVLLKRYLDVKEKELIDMNNGIINGDRGYEFDVKIINAKRFNTTKRSSTLPFSFGKCNSQHKSQFIIPESGYQTTYRATMKSTDEQKELVAYH